jgi:hypothetical protein
MNKLRVYLQICKASPVAATAATRKDYEETVPADAVPIRRVIAKIKHLASLEPTELADKLDTEEGANLAQVEIEPAELQSLLRPWNSIRRASPDPLTDGQYDAFLRGEHPMADAVELYGSHLRSET